MHATPLEVLAQEFGAISGQLARETRLRLDAAIAEGQRHEAERELRFSKLEHMIVDLLALVKDGTSVTVSDVAPIIVAEIDRRFAELPKPKDGDAGKDADMILTAALVRQNVIEAVSALPPPKDGKDADMSIVPDDVADQVSRAIALLAESPQISNKNPPLVLNISSVAAERTQRSRKIITTRRDANGNMVAEVVGE